MSASGVTLRHDGEVVVKGAARSGYWSQRPADGRLWAVLVDGRADHEYLATLYPFCKVVGADSLPALRERIAAASKRRVIR